MGNLLVNIRFKCTHLQISRYKEKYSTDSRAKRIRFTHNEVHRNNPKWFEVYEFFGI